MSDINYLKHERITLKGHPKFNEHWVQERIAEDPSILGLGDLILKDKERIQPKAGRLDLLLQDPDSESRYEVEIQLGSTDEKHIIHTIEYWDIEKKRYPQYDHTAVIVAEDITARFFNVISLFNGFIPLIAIQMSAIKMAGNISLVCTTVLSQINLGLIDEDEELHEQADRSYWEQRGTKETVEIADSLLEIIRGFNPNFDLKYNKFYIGLAENEQANNFAIFRPQKNGLRLEVKIPKSEEIESAINQSGVDFIDYQTRTSRYRIRLMKGDIKKNEEFLRKLFLDSYNFRKD